MSRTDYSRDHEPSPGFVLVGRVIAPHGVDGAVRVYSFTDSPERFTPGTIVYVRGLPYHLDGVTKNGNTLVLSFGGVDSLEDAAVFRGAIVEVPEKEVYPLQEGFYYHFQIIDLQVFSVQGQWLGIVKDILSTGANDVFLIQGGEREVLVPALDDVVVDVDIERKRMIVDIPEGL
jgi:16S rRNA processing protein RimM